MKLLFAIFFAFQVLLSSTLAFAHMAVDAHDLNDSVHQHMGTEHHDSAADVEQEHDDGSHFHLCAFVLNSASDIPPIQLGLLPTPFGVQPSYNVDLPPVPPPNIQLC